MRLPAATLPPAFDLLSAAGGPVDGGGGGAAAASGPGAHGAVRPCGRPRLRPGAIRAVVRTAAACRRRLIARRRGMIQGFAAAWHRPGSRLFFEALGRNQFNGPHLFTSISHKDKALLQFQTTYQYKESHKDFNIYSERTHAQAARHAVSEPVPPSELQVSFLLLHRLNPLEGAGAGAVCGRQLSASGRQLLGDLRC